MTPDYVDVTLRSPSLLMEVIILSMPASALLTTPALARVHNGVTGGAMPTFVDRELPTKVLGFIRAMRITMAHRRFVPEAIRRVHAEGVMQILDIGCVSSSKG
jgi:hypothetical protein